MQSSAARMPTKGENVVIAPEAFRAKRTAVDREFLPPALELIDTPTSPVTVVLIWLVCIGFATALAWSYFGRLDIYATASGKIQPVGGSKVLQPLAAGRVIAMHVENGSHVKAGEILLELDPTETAADVMAREVELEATRAEIARRQVAITIARSDTFRTKPIPFDESISERIRQREESVLTAEVGQLSTNIDSLRAQLAEAMSKHDRVSMTMAARDRLLTVLKERVDTRNALDESGQGYRSRVVDALQEYEREKTNLASDQGELKEADANRISIEAKIQEQKMRFVSEQTTKLAEAQEKRDRLAQDLVKAKSRENDTKLKAPISGVVQQLSVTTVGQIVSSGQSLMTIVPDDSTLEVEAMILNRDIGFVKVGQPVTLKIDAFPFTRYGTLEGKIVSVSKDGVDQKTAANLSDVSSLTKPQGSSASTNSTTAETLAFPARIAISRQTFSADGRDERLSPGMAVTADILTGNRRAIDFLLSPLREIQSESFQER